MGHGLQASTHAAGAAAGLIKHKKDLASSKPLDRLSLAPFKQLQPGSLASQHSLDLYLLCFSACKPQNAAPTPALTRAVQAGPGGPLVLLPPLDPLEQFSCCHDAGSSTGAGITTPTPLPMPQGVHALCGRESHLRDYEHTLGAQGVAEGAAQPAVWEPHPAQCVLHAASQAFICFCSDRHRCKQQQRTKAKATTGLDCSLSKLGPCLLLKKQPGAQIVLRTACTGAGFGEPMK